MLSIAHNVSLRPYNTFGIDANAKHLVHIHTHDQALAAVNMLKNYDRYLILGGGSNVLFTNNVDGLVVINKIKGIDIVAEDDDTVTAHVGAGEIWHEFVLWCISHNYGGIENLSLIPGTVGAAPMQNIGAYGVEVKSVIKSVEAIDLKTYNTTVINAADCEFAYRSSIFKTHAKNRYLITGVNFILQKHPHFNTSYGAIENELAKMGVAKLTLQAVSEAVISIRRSKLPDPQVTGNAGSFFKNPEVDIATYLRLQESFSNIVAYKTNETTYKLAAGWMIEHCGFKGVEHGGAACHKMQALVLINHDNATGHEVLELAQKIVNGVYQKFGVRLEMEVNVV